MLPGVWGCGGVAEYVQWVQEQAEQDMGGRSANEPQSERAYAYARENLDPDLYGEWSFEEHYTPFRASYVERAAEIGTELRAKHLK